MLFLVIRLIVQPIDFFYLENKIIFESGDAIFYEEKFPFKLKNSGGEENILSQPSSSTSYLQPMVLQPDRRSTISKFY